MTLIDKKGRERRGDEEIPPIRIRVMIGLGPRDY